MREPKTKTTKLKQNWNKKTKSKLEQKPEEKETNIHGNKLH
jgi:hypothetical protein